MCHGQKYDFVHLELDAEPGLSRLVRLGGLGYFQFRTQGDAHRHDDLF
jgi:hypothetical protein